MNIIVIFLGIVISVFALVLIPITISYYKKEKAFRQNCIKCKATVRTYYDSRNRFCPYVVLEPYDSLKMYSCNSRKRIDNIYQPGSEVSVEYVVTRRLGLDWCDVRMAEPPYAPKPYGLMPLFCIMLSIFTASSVVLIITGALSL